MIFEALVISLVLQLIFFIPAFLFKTDKFTDFTYGLTFIILAILFYLESVGDLYRQLLAIMIIVWALRLAIYLVVRIRKIGRDSRFDETRDHFFKFLQFWLLQGFVVWVVMIPAIYFFTSSLSVNPIWFIVGSVLFWKGLLIEGIADQQKFSFKNNKKNAGKWCDVGLWKYSRHPNYYGEMMIWVGIYIAVVTGITQYYIALLGPLLIILVLRYGSGVPPLEKRYDKKYKKNKKYQDYKRKTNLLIIGPRRR
ncbi:MAG: steroid 5-alpha reductase family enzyme [Patescibacteria group bacterium]|jgi:steroid 5-alpha reductase family enzyme